MNRNKRFFLMIFISVLIFSSGCKKYTNFEADDYYLKLPTTQNYSPDYNNDTTIIELNFKQTQYNVSVITKNVSDFYTLNNCISKELECFLQGESSKNIITKKTNINGSETTLISGVNIINNKKIHWSFAIFHKDYKYYVVRVSSEESFLSFNEYFNEQIIYSFHLK